MNKANKYKAIIDQMLLNEDFCFAEKFLLSVLKQIKEKNRISGNQIQAIKNIIGSVERRTGEKIDFDW